VLFLMTSTGSSELITIAASNVTIADLTIKRARDTCCHVTSSGSADTSEQPDLQCRIIDSGPQGYFSGRESYSLTMPGLLVSGSLKVENGPNLH
jgi:hypothetical protein